MTSLMQSASALALAAVIAAAPLAAKAQQETETEAEQAVEEVVQETEQAVEQAGEATEEALDEAARETGEAAGEAAETVDQATETIEAEVIVEGAEESEAEVIVEGAEGTAEPAQVPTDETVTVTAMPVEEVEGTIVLQDENSFLTSDLMDAAVYNAAGEKVGEIDDAILSLDGMVEGVVIGVGGFLGIGEKHVAVEMQQISLQTNEDGEPQLIIETTREALEAAPDFVSVEEQKDEAAAQALEQAPAGDAPQTGGMMTADPAPAGMAPAGTAPAGEEQPTAPAAN